LPRDATERRGRGGTKGSGSAATTPDRVADFFAELADRGQEPLLAKVTGTARFDVVDGGGIEHWRVAIEKGAITVSRRSGGADAVVRGSRETFERVAAGELNVMAAVMREELGVGGDPRLLVHLQRLFPRPGSPQ
jgi:putative sterol carrier protein